MKTEYELRKTAAGKRVAEASLSGRDIGGLPPLADPGRREAARGSFRAFLESYWPSPPAADETDIGQVEAGVHGGFLVAPREAVRATLWVVLFGQRAHVVLVGRDPTHARTLLDGVKHELGDNDLLLEDFPEVCFPITGQRRLPGWTVDRIILPSIPGSPASEALLRAVAATARIAALAHQRSDGIVVWPDLFVFTA